MSCGDFVAFVGTTHGWNVAFYRSYLISYFNRYL